MIGVAFTSALNNVATNLKLLNHTIGMALTAAGLPDDDPEHDKYTLATGCCVMFLGEFTCYSEGN